MISIPCITCGTKLDASGCCPACAPWPQRPIFDATFTERVRCAVIVLDFLGPQQLWFTTSPELERGRNLLSALAKEILRGDAK